MLFATSYHVHARTHAYVPTGVLYEPIHGSNARTPVTLVRQMHANLYRKHRHHMIPCGRGYGTRASMSSSAARENSVADGRRVRPFEITIHLRLGELFV